MKRLAIIGASELGCLIAHQARGDFEITGFYDDRALAPKRDVGIATMLGSTGKVLEDFRQQKFDCLMIGIGYAAMEARQALFERFVGDIPFANVIHESCHVDKHARLGSGIFLMPGCTVDFEADLESNVACQIGCSISHHTHIGAHSFLGPGACLAGCIEVEQRCFIGVGSTISDSLRIGSGSIIGAGAVVIDEIPSNSVAVGVPARVIKQTQPGGP